MNWLNERINDSLIKTDICRQPTGGLVIFKSVIAVFQNVFVCLKKICKNINLIQVFMHLKYSSVNIPVHLWYHSASYIVAIITCFHDRFIYTLYIK